MSTIFDLSYRYVVPSLRRALVVELRKQGLSQKEISQILGISHSAVSRYLSAERGQLLDVTKFKDIAEGIKELASNIKQGRKDLLEIHKEIYRLTLKILARKYLCNLHVKLNPAINPQKCRICPELFTPVIFPE